MNHATPPTAAAIAISAKAVSPFGERAVLEAFAVVAVAVAFAAGRPSRALITSVGWATPFEFASRQSVRLMACTI
ncbi:MAG: hypothetical protein ABL956_12080 [Hyphomonadaceae bacterium]